ncbi:MAG: hypothetical protein M3365_01740 [Gemmatimonadota bacterium]|nr:hypothetical protein [Gemmatimonadota bacterium]
MDLDSRLVERWRPRDDRPEILTDRIVWHTGGTAEPLALELTTFFRDVIGDDATAGAP